MPLPKLVALLLITTALTLLVGCAVGGKPVSSPTPYPTTSASAPLAIKAPTIVPEAAQVFGASGLIADLESWATIELPYFITASHMDLADIAFVSKFRSTAGHDFSDSFETCCSMKHYFHNIDHYATRFTQPIYSMVDGVVFYLQEHQTGPYGAAYLNEETGYEAMTGKKIPADYFEHTIFIRPNDAPNVWVQHKHVKPLDEIVKTVPPVTDLDLMRGVGKPAPIGYRVQAGELIGHGLGEIIVQRYLDGAGFPSPCNSGDVRKRLGHVPGCRDTVQLHSIFEFMTDSVFVEYQKLAAEAELNVSRADFIITAEERAANPLKCDAELFTEPGYLTDGVSYIQFQESITTLGRSLIDGVKQDGKPSTQIVTPITLPGFSALAPGREAIASFEGSGSHAPSEFNAEGPYLLVIASKSGPIEISIINDGSGPRDVYSRPSSSGVSTYETRTLEPGQIEISVQANENVSWQIVVVKLE